MSRYLVQATTRRKAFLLADDGTSCEATLLSSAGDIVCGDYVTLRIGDQNPVIEAVNPRRNLLSRSYGEKTKLLAANLDILFIVAAVHPLLNTIFIDRTIAACIYEEIPYALVINKSDLEFGESKLILDLYAALGITVIITCAKQPDGINTLEDYIKDKTPHSIALCGISGVGKSSLINRLIPDAIQKTSEVSRKTGQGKQTTTMAQAYIRRIQNEQQIIIDLPGLQNFGISHIPLSELRNCFSEFIEPANRCQFADCTHTIEPNCAVMSAKVAGNISESRYASYLHMREELIRGKPY